MVKISVTEASPTDGEPSTTAAAWLVANYKLTVRRRQHLRSTLLDANVDSSAPPHSRHRDPIYKRPLSRGPFAYAKHPAVKNSSSKPLSPLSRSQELLKTVLRIHTLATNARRHLPSLTPARFAPPGYKSPLPALHRIETHPSKPSFKVLLH